VKSGKCVKCGSTDVLENVEVRDQDRHAHRPLNLVVRIKPPRSDAPTKTAEHSEVRAWVCGACGYTELYAAKPKALLAARRGG
jgi:predicted nucleic-acid-binding Zn-ribbon protein